MTEEEGIQWVRGTIRAAMVKRRMTYADLVEQLKVLGIEENERNLRNKVARGTFSAVFFVSCLEAMGVYHLPLGMHAAMALPEGERNFGSLIMPVPSKRETKHLLKLLGATYGRSFSSMDEYQRHADSHPSPPDDTNSSSMEEILASIRRIISEDAVVDADSEPSKDA